MFSHNRKLIQNLRLRLKINKILLLFFFVKNIFKKKQIVFIWTFFFVKTHNINMFLYFQIF